MRPTPGKIVLLAIAGIALAILVGWKIVVALRSDETRVRLVLEDVASLARGKDAGGVLEYLDPAFTGPGGMTCADVRPVVVGYLMQAKSVAVEIEPVSPVAVEGDVATVTVRASLSMKVQGQTVTLRDAELEGDLFVVTLKRHESYFRCTGVREATEDDPGSFGPAQLDPLLATRGVRARPSRRHGLGDG